MRMHVDKARRDQLAFGVDLFLAFASDPADIGDATVLDGDVAFIESAAASVGDRAAADHKVMSHGVSSRLPNWAASSAVTVDCQRLALGLSNASASRSSSVSCFGGVFRSVKNVSTTVIAMNSAETMNTACGMFWSMIQPNSSGLAIPEKLKPVETMAKARPAAPGGAALRT